jgi:protein tyrosine/serine phosphatase
MISPRLRFIAAVFFTAALALTPACSAAQSTAPGEEARAGAPAEKIKAKGLPNLGRVSSNLYRGGQPEARHKAFEQLRDLGIDIVVNLRNEQDDTDAEQRIVESLGMQFVAIPWSGYRDPDHAQVAEFLRLVRENPDKQIFVHCRRGAERTGVMLAAYRMSVEGWTPEQALEEMEEFKFRGFWFRHLKRYVREFPEHWEKEPAFAPLRTAPAVQPAASPAAAGRPAPQP